MDIPTIILFLTSGVIMIASIIFTSFKNGFVSYSMFSAIRQDRPRFEIDKTKIGRFVRFLISAFLLNILYGLVLIRDLSQLGGIAFLSLIDMVFIGYALLYGILLKEKS